MEGFKRNRVKLLELKDDTILLMTQTNDTRYNVFSTELEILFRSGKKINVKYITNDRIQFHEGLFPAYLGTMKSELKEITFLEFVEELKNFGADCGYNTNISY